MNILYLSCHSILEEAELRLFHELGHEVFSLGGAYQNPQSPGDPKRPAIDGLKFNQHLHDIALQCSKDNIHDDLLKWADVVITMHRLDWLEKNWAKIREYKVIPVWRSIGQSIDMWERKAEFLRPEGLRIIRYSPREKYIPFYAGEDAMIRFGVDPKEYTGWRGGSGKVHVYGQSVPTPERKDWLHYDISSEVTRDVPRVLYGPGNSACEWSGGELTYEELKNSYRAADVAFYTGTVPASYTLSFIEMAVIGVPMVCIGKDLFNCNKFFPGQDTYEIPDIIRNGKNGFVSDDLGTLSKNIKDLLSSQNLRFQISNGIRQSAIELFSKNTTRSGWEAFFASL